MISVPLSFQPKEILPLKNIFIYTVSVLFVGLGFIACDSTTSPRDLTQEAPSISELELSPKSVEFTKEEDGSSSDTTINIKIQVQAENLSEDDILQYVFSLKNSEENLLEGQLETTDSSPYTHSANVEIETSTTSIEDYVVNVFFNNESGAGNYAQTSFSIVGFSNDPPEILDTENPDEVQIPSNGITSIQFKAKVTDVDGQNNIQGVFMRLISQSTGEVPGSPFQLFDDGQNSGDETAQDSVFTLSLEIDSNNNPDLYDLEYYAIDKGDLVSDTVKSTLRIRE